MPWRESRRRRKEAEEWRRENQRRMLDRRLGLSPEEEEAGREPPDDADGATRAGTRTQEAPPAAPAPPPGDAPRPAPTDGAAPPVPPRRRPGVPVELGVVSDDEHARAVRRVVSRALAEDLGHRGDVTSLTTVPVRATGHAALVAREPGVVAGLEVVDEVVRQVDTRIRVELLVRDGARVAAGDVVARLSGPLRTLLTAERTLLNLVCQLSGVATHTAAFAAALEGLDCVVRDTRKTTPGLRLLEKRAVQVGGGANHRVGLYDAILVKDNHVAAAGGVGAAARAAMDGAPVGVHVQVEVTDVAGAEEAIAAGVEDLLLDNFSPTELRHAVEVIAGRAAVEASGGITLETARAYAEAGADRLAVGALTHSAPALDLALDVEQVVGRVDVEVDPAPFDDRNGDRADGGGQRPRGRDLFVERAPFDDAPEPPTADTSDASGASDASGGGGS